MKLTFDSNTSCWALLKGGEVQGKILAVYKKCSAGFAVKVTLDLWDRCVHEEEICKGMGYNLTAHALGEIIMRRADLFGEHQFIEAMNNDKDILLRIGYKKVEVC